MYNWYKVEDFTASDLEERKLREVIIGEKEIGLVKKDGKVFAFAGTCPHAGVRLCEGWMDAQGRIVCPEHLYRFDPANGRNTSGEGYKLRTYPVEEKDGFIYIGIIN